MRGAVIIPGPVRIALRPLNDSHLRMRANGDSLGTTGSGAFSLHCCTAGTTLPPLGAGNPRTRQLAPWKAPLWPVIGFSQEPLAASCSATKPRDSWSVRLHG